MDKEQRKIFLTSFPTLLDFLEPNDVLPYLYPQYLTEGDIEDVKSEVRREDRVLKLFFILLRKLESIEPFIHCLKSLKMPDPVINHFSEVVLSASIPFTPSEEDTVLKIFDNQLRELYVTHYSMLRLFPKVPHSVVRIDKIWVNLELSQPREVSEDVSYMQVISSALAFKLPVIMKGVPGVGKSTITKKICFDWATERYADYDYIIVAQIRDVRSADSLLHLAMKWLQNRMSCLQSRQTFEKVLSTFASGKYKLLVLIDGYDEGECDCKELSYLCQEESMVVPYSVIITTHPYKLREIQCAHQLITIHGFSKRQQLDYIHSYFEAKGTPAEAGEIKTLLEKNTELQKTAKIPLLLYLICTVGGAVHTFRFTDLYLAFIDWLTEKYEKRIGVPINSRKYPNVHQLGQMAYEGLVDTEEGKLIFSQADLEQYHIDPECFELGFLSRESSYTLGKKCEMFRATFPHKTFQELFAAIFLSNEIELCLESQDSETPYKSVHIENLKDILRRNAAIVVRLEQVLYFLVGLCENTLPIYESLIIRLVQGVSYEMTRDHMMVRRIHIEASDHKIRNTLEQIIHTSNPVWVTKMQQILSGPRNEDMISLEAGVYLWTDIDKDRWVILDDTVADSNLSQLCQALENPVVQETENWWYSGSGRNFILFLNAGRQTLDCLKLEIQGHFQVSGDSSQLTLPNFQQLICDSTEAEDCRQALEVCQQLFSKPLSKTFEFLHIVGAEISLHLSEMFSNLPLSISQLDIGSVILTRDEVGRLLSVLPKLHQLAHLGLVHCSIPADSLVQLLGTLSHHSKLKFLNLTGNPTLSQESVFTELSRFVSHTKTLKFLRLNSCNLSDSQVSNLLYSLAKLQTIEELHLGCNRIELQETRDLLEKFESDFKTQVIS